MKTVIITFSPSGNTAGVGDLLKSELVELGGSVEHYDITKDHDIFNKNDIAGFLAKSIKQHDVLCVGAPVYEHHVQETMVELINLLPKPDSTWGRYVLPFVTYGYINSGIALEQAGRLLSKSGRTVISGMKISAAHTMFETILNRQIYTLPPQDEVLAVVKTAAKRIMDIDKDNNLSSQSYKLRYKPLLNRVVDNTLLNPKLKFIDLLPKLIFDKEKCVGCNICVKKCPTNHLSMGADGKVEEDLDKLCLRCLNCIKYCPKDVISQNKKIKLIETMLKLLTINGFEMPQNAVYPEVLE